MSKTTLFIFLLKVGFSSSSGKQINSSAISSSVDSVDAHDENWNDTYGTREQRRPPPPAGKSPPGALGPPTGALGAPPGVIRPPPAALGAPPGAKGAPPGAIGAPPGVVRPPSRAIGAPPGALGAPPRPEMFNQPVRVKSSPAVVNRPLSSGTPNRRPPVRGAAVNNFNPKRPPPPLIVIANDFASLTLSLSAFALMMAL